MEISHEMDETQSGQGHTQTQAQTSQHTLLYVVQRCWHSGPQQHVPVDMLRLFHTQREAEEAAYHSAKAFYECHAKPSSGALKTLMLPSYPAHNPQGSSYGFLACGGLFWVRALRATVVVSGSSSSSTTDSNHPSPNQVCHSSAYAILTEGVIGGTGNRNSRRGTEACDGRVFGGDATARQIAMQAVARVKDSFGLISKSSLQLQIEALTVPVGKPVEWLSSGAFVGDWPLHAGVGNIYGVDMDTDTATATANTTTTTTTTHNHVPFGTTPKRRIEASSGSFDAWGRSVSRDTDEDFGKSSVVGVIGFHGNQNQNGCENENENFLVVDCPFEEPIAKRRRVVSVTSEFGGMDTIMQ